MFKPYDTHQFNTLPDFETAKSRPRSVLDQAQRCGRILCRYGCHDLLAVGLLHKHFDLEPGEQLVRTVPHPAQAYAVPRIVKSTDEVLPWMWRFGAGVAGLGWYPLEYVEATAAGRGLHTLLQHCEPLFDELAAALVRHDLIDVFGITAAYADEDLATARHEQVVETSSTSPRRLDLRVAPRPTDGDDGDATVTQFRWRGALALELAGAR